MIRGSSEWQWRVPGATALRASVDRSGLRIQVPASARRGAGMPPRIAGRASPDSPGLARSAFADRKSRWQPPAVQLRTWARSTAMVQTSPDAGCVRVAISSPPGPTPTLTAPAKGSAMHRKQGQRRLSRATEGSLTRRRNIETKKTELQSNSKRCLVGGTEGRESETAHIFA